MAPRGSAPRPLIGSLCLIGGTALAVWALLGVGWTGLYGGLVWARADSARWEITGGVVLTVAGWLLARR